MRSSVPARSRAIPPTHTPPETVDPRWILKALGAVLALGLLCSYITLCLFFFNGQWQFVLHPSRVISQTPASLHLAFQAVRFGDDTSGQPQLSGWWIPAELPSDPTVLMLHSENGSMSDALSRARVLHDARLNVLLFDYRGYGQSGGGHPTEAMMQHDTDQALAFLTDARHTSLPTTLVFGEGLGASLATRLCQRNPGLPALILVNADGDTASRVEADQRSRIVPVNLLFHERFPLADPLHVLPTPKLLISLRQGSPPEFAVRAASPKTTAELPSGANPAQLTAVVRRFLDSYISRPAPELKPTP